MSSNKLINNTYEEIATLLGIKQKQLRASLLTYYKNEAK